MFIIREEQMKVFDDYAYQEFVDEMVVHLQTDYPKQTAEMSEPELRKMVEDGVERAEKYDITTVSDVERFLGYMLILGPDFDVAPQTSWAGDILRREETRGTAKMDSIDEHMNFETVE